MGILLFCVICHIKRTETTSVFGISLAGASQGHAPIESLSKFRGAGYGVREGGALRAQVYIWPSALIRNSWMLWRVVSGRILRPCCFLFYSDGRYREGFFVRAVSFSTQTGDIGKDSSSVTCPFLPRRAVTGRAPLAASIPGEGLFHTGRNSGLMKI